MKPAAFDYFRPATLAEACALLAGAGDDADRRVLAGGQSLVPMMAMRLARPTHLVDISRIAELQGIRDRGDHVEIGAGTRQRAVEKDPVTARKLPLLAAALPHVGHHQTRNRGTIGGSIALGDASAEIPLVALVLNATFVIHGRNGRREAPAKGFFEGPMMTALAPDEILAAIRFPVWSGVTGCGFHEIAPRRGDYALVSAAAQIALDADGICTRAAVGVGGCAPTPLRLPAVEDALVGKRLTDAPIAEAVASVPGLIDPESSTHASDAYRRRAAPHLVQRALRDALAAAAA
ncbi:MAG: xanthine dehydrogenase family protein subunit M [Alphaproteobacteria bacterium]